MIKVKLSGRIKEELANGNTAITIDPELMEQKEYEFTPENMYHILELMDYCGIDYGLWDTQYGINGQLYRHAELSFSFIIDFNIE